MNRTRKEEKVYRKYRKKIKASGECQFCKIAEGHDQFIKETGSFVVIRNRFPYSIWDSQRVTDHLMVVPKRHTDTLSDITPDQASEYLHLIGSYERKGYDVFARHPGSKIKSVFHQHTHLIHTDGKILKTLLYKKKPFIRIAH